MAPDGTVFAFGRFELDLSAGRLVRDGVAVHLPPQPYRALELLVREAGRLVTREALAHHLWRGETFVDVPAGLNFCIKQLRDTLGDSATAPAFIETIPRRGYRFIATVVDRSAERAVTMPMPALDARPRRAAAIWLTAAFALAALAGADRATMVRRAVPLSIAQIDAAALVDAALLRLDELDTDGVRERIEWLERAMAGDPRSARASAGLAEAFVEIGRLRGVPPPFAYARARVLAAQAVALDPNLGEAHGVLGRVALLQDWNWREADTELTRAVALAPGVARLHQWRSSYLSAAREHDEALVEARLAVTLDPTSVTMGAWWGRAHLLAGDPAGAAAICEPALASVPASMDLRDCVLAAAVELGRPARGVDRYTAALEATGDARHAAAMRRVFAEGGVPALAVRYARQLEASLSGPRLTDESMTIASMFSRAHDRDATLRWLRRAAEAHLDAFIWIRSSPALRALADDPEFRALERRAVGNHSGL